MIPKPDWIRVNSKNPCPVCKKSDWCGYTPQGVVCCMRIQSNKPAKNGGWIHSADTKALSTPAAPYVRQEEKKTDFYALWRELRRHTKSLELVGLGEALGIHPQALWLMGCVWFEYHQAFVFPMYDGNGNMSGMRLRNLEGKKWAITGSKQGIFLQNLQGEDMPKMIAILEGPTDSAAAVSLGLKVIGRPSCMGCHEAVNETIKRFKITRAVIFADNDDQGRIGADKLKETLSIKSCTFHPPAKDFREFVNLGGTLEALQSSVKNLVWS